MIFFKFLFVKKEVHKFNEDHNQKIENLTLELNKQIQLIAKHYDKYERLLILKFDLLIQFL